MPPVTVIYELTERGQALIPALDLIAAWARDTFRPAIADSNARPPLAFDAVRTQWRHQLAMALCRLAASFCHGEPLIPDDGTTGDHGSQK